MSTETARIKIDVDVDEIRALIAALQSLSSQADELDKDLKDVEGQAKDTDSALGGMGQSMIAGAAAGGVAAAAMAAFGAAVELVKVGIEQFKQGLESLSETNSQVAAGASSVSNAMTSLRETMVLALLGGDDMNQSFGAVTAVLQNFERIIQENADQIAEFARGALVYAIDGIGTLIDIAGSLVIGFNNLKLVGKTVELGVFELVNAWLAWNTMVADGVLVYLQFLIDGYTALISTMENVANAIPGVSVNLSGVTDVTQGLSDGIQNTRDTMNGFADDVAAATQQARIDYDQFATDILQANDNIRESTNSLAGSFSMISDLLDAGLTESYVEVTETQNTYTRSVTRTIEEVETLIDKLTELYEVISGPINTATLDFITLISDGFNRGLELSAEAVEAAKNSQIEDAQKLSDALLEIKESEAEKLAAIDEAENARLAERSANIEQWTSISVDAFGSVASALGELAVKTNESGAKKVKRLFGGLTADILDASANLAIAQSGITALFDPASGGFPNPVKSAGLLAAGLAAKVAASAIRAKLGAGGGGGGGSRGATGTGRAVPQTQGQNAGGTRTVVLNNSFNGLTTDPRGTARQLEDTLQSNQRLFGE